MLEFSQLFLITTIFYTIYVWIMPEKPEEQPVINEIIKEKIIIDETLTNELKEQIELLNKEIENLNNIIKSKDNQFLNLEIEYYKQLEQLEVYNKIEPVDISSYEKQIKNLKEQLQQRNVEIIDAWS